MCIRADDSLLTVDTGVKIDKETRYTAGIMLLSLIPYIIVQLADIFKAMFGSHVVILIALIVSSASLLLYFAYQVAQLIHC